MCGGDKINKRERNTQCEGDKISTQSLEEWLRSHSEILKDPWEGFEWEDKSPLNEHPVVIDPTLGKENYCECIQNKRYGSI